MSETTPPEESNRHPNDGFNIVGDGDDVALGLFVTYPVESVGETVHVVADADEREVRIYRWVDRDEDGQNKRIKTTMPLGRLGLKIERDDEFRHWCIQGPDARTFLTFLDFVAERYPSEYDISISYYENNGKTMYNDSEFTQESLRFTYEEGEYERKICLKKTYTTDVHMFGRFSEGVL